MIEREKRVLARHYLDEGVSRAAVARRVGIGRRTLYNWIAGGLLEGRLGDQKGGYGPRQPRTSKLDPFKGIIRARLARISHTHKKHRSPGDVKFMYAMNLTRFPTEDRCPHTVSPFPWHFKGARGAG